MILQVKVHQETQVVDAHLPSAVSGAMLHAMSHHQNPKILVVGTVTYEYIDIDLPILIVRHVRYPHAVVPVHYNHATINHRRHHGASFLPLSHSAC